MHVKFFNKRDFHFPAHEESYLKECQIGVGGGKANDETKELSGYKNEV